MSVNNPDDLDSNWSLPKTTPVTASTSPVKVTSPDVLSSSWALPKVKANPTIDPTSTKDPNIDPSSGKPWGWRNDLSNAWKDTKTGAAWLARQVGQGVESLPIGALDTGIAAVNLGKHALNYAGLDKDPTYAPYASQVNSQGLDQAFPSTQTTSLGGQVLGGAIQGMVGARLPQGVQPQSTGQLLAPNTRAPVPGQTAGQVTGNPDVQSVESTLARAPGGGALRATITQQKDALNNNLQGTIDSLSGGQATTPYSVGNALDPALRQGARDLKAVGGAPFEKIDAAMGDANVAPKNTLQVLQAMVGKSPGAPNLSAAVSDPLLKSIYTALTKDLDTNAGFIPYSDLKSVQQQLNNRIDWTGVNGDASNGALKQVYLAIRNDLNETAEIHGQGDAVTAANKNWQNVSDRLDSINQALSANGGPEQMFNKLVSGAKLGPSGLMAVLDHIPDSSQRLLAAGMLQRMGLKGGASGTFDADTFFNNWNKMDPDAKNRLFGSLPQNYRQNIEQIATNVKTLRAYNNVLPNASGTAKAAVWSSSITGALTALISGNPKTAAALTVGVPLATKGLSSVLTNPRIVSWLARESAPAKVLGMTGATPALIQNSGASTTSAQPSASPQ